MPSRHVALRFFFPATDSTAQHSTAQGPPSFPPRTASGGVGAVLSGLVRHSVRRPCLFTAARMEVAYWQQGADRHRKELRTDLGGREKKG